MQNIFENKKYFWQQQTFSPIIPILALLPGLVSLKTKETHGKKDLEEGVYVGRI